MKSVGGRVGCPPRRHVTGGALAALVVESASPQTGSNACKGKPTGAGWQAELSFSSNFSVRALEIFLNKDRVIT